MSDPTGTLIPKLSGPANDALALAGYSTLEQLAAVTPKDLLALHGVGPKAIRILREHFAAHGLAFAGEKPAPHP